MATVVLPRQVLNKFLYIDKIVEPMQKHYTMVHHIVDHLPKSGIAQLLSTVSSDVSVSTFTTHTL